MKNKNKEDGNLHTLIRPIKYQMNDTKNQEGNVFGWHEMILLAHDNRTVHVVNVTYDGGVFDEMEYSSYLAEEFWETMAEFYICEGFIDLDSVRAGYLKANRWELIEKEK